MAARKLSPRGQRRLQARGNAKLVKDRERLARLEVGGSPDNPVNVVSASVVEAQAGSVPCPLCGEKLRVGEHTAETIHGVRLRVAHMACTQCGAPRSLYFRIAPPLPN